MPFKNVCFISYRSDGSRDSYGNRMVQAFKDALSEQLSLSVPRCQVYLDSERIQGGDFINQSLAHELCHSCSMVLLFNPYYFDSAHTYCAREYYAMKDLEKKRLRRLTPNLRRKGFIIPVVLRGEDCVPPEIKQSRNFVDLSADLLMPADFKKRTMRQRIDKEVAKVVFDRYWSLRNLGNEILSDCAEFSFPEENEIQPWLKYVIRGQKGPTMPGE